MIGCVVIRAADKHDAYAVLSQMSEQTRSEFEVLGESPSALVDSVVRNGYPMYVSSAGDRLLTLFGFSDFGTYASMWTIATDAYFNLGPSGVLRTRKFLQGIDLGKPLYLVTTAPHPEADRWFELLGFEKVRDDGTRREFLYRR
jgi:hypothetical protein